MNGRQEYSQKAEATIGSTLPYWDPKSNNFIYNLVTKSKFYEKPTLDNLRLSFENMRGHALLNNVTKTTMPKVGRGFYKLQWTNVFKLIQNTFTYSGVQIHIITKREADSIRRNPSSNNEQYVENELENYTN